MLLELEIHNFALLDHVRLEFAAGFNVLTGETGAGKSIVLDALSFLLGGSPRDQAGPGRVAGRFLTNDGARAVLLELGWEAGDEVLLSREIGAGGRSSCRIDSRLATLANLRELGAQLVEIHGQHQSVALQKPARQLELLDRRGGPGHLQTLDKYRQVHRRCRELEAAREELGRRTRDRQRELEWVRHELQEIDSAGPQAGEDERLEGQVRRLAAAQQLGARVAESCEHLRGERGACDQVGAAVRALQAIARLDEGLAPWMERLQEAEILLLDVAHELSAYEVSSDPEMLEEMQTRCEQLKTLKRKYGADLTEVLEYAEKARGRLAELESAEERAGAIEAELEAAEAERRLVGQLLTEGRQQAARELTGQVHRELEALGLAAMRFSVEIGAAEPCLAGCETVEFQLAANPGTSPRPLARVASGGELSRLMLALISLFSGQTGVDTLVFDEIDAGLGGRAAEAVARRLQSLAEGRQVLCVTHLAVIAAGASHHVRVSKSIQGARTEVTLEVLRKRQREEEIARMLSGDASPQAAARHARGLLAKASEGLPVHA